MKHNCLFLLRSASWPALAIECYVGAELARRCKEIGVLYRTVTVMDLESVPSIVPRIPGHKENRTRDDVCGAAESIIVESAPSVVVACGDAAFLAAAHRRGIPAIYLGLAWPPAGDGTGRDLRGAAAAVIMADVGVFTIPRDLTCDPVHVGLLGPHAVGMSSARRYKRRRHGMTTCGPTIVVIPDRMSSNSQEFAEKVISAFLGFDEPDKQLSWIAAPGTERLSASLQEFRSVQVIDPEVPVDRWMQTADVVITEGDYEATALCASYRVPSISLTSGNKPVDDLLVPRIWSNLPLSAAATDEVTLRAALKDACMRAFRWTATGVGGPELAAGAIRREIERLSRANRGKGRR